MSQLNDLLWYLKQRGEHGATSLDIIRDCHIVNTTGRISELREQLRKVGKAIECRKEKVNGKVKPIFKFYYVD